MSLWMIGLHLRQVMLSVDLELCQHAEAHSAASAASRRAVDRLDVIVAAAGAIEELPAAGHPSGARRSCVAGRWRA